MARTKDEIFDSMDELREADDVLSASLTSKSKASFFRSLFYLFAEATGDFELIYDDFVSQVSSLLETKRMHTAYWWYETSLEYQYGYPLEVLENGNIGYGEIVEDAKIVKRAAVTSDAQGYITLKVAGESSDGDAEALGSLQLAAFKSYIEDVSPAGIVVAVISSQGDELSIAMTVEVDDQIINPSDGSLYTDSETLPIESAIEDFIDDFQGSSFGGVFYANKLLSAVLAVNGVTNVVFNQLDAKGFGSEEVDVLLADGKKYFTYSGYLAIETLDISYSNGS